MRGRVIVSLVTIGLLAGMATGAPAATKPERGYITNTFTVPTSGTQAQELGRDLDGDGSRDNKLGEILATFSGQGFAVATATGEAIEIGDIVMLHSLRTFSLANTKNATWQVWYGAPTAEPPDFSGSGVFLLPAAQPHSGKLAATIKDHKVKTAAGKIPLRLDFGGGPFVVKTFKSKVFATCTKSGCTNGQIGGAVTEEEVHAKFFPEFAEALTALLAADCSVPIETVVCESGSTGETVDVLYNLNEDLVISLVELEENQLTQAVFTPDLDLFKANGDPGHNGMNDSFSLGVGFTTVKATLTRP